MEPHRQFPRYVRALGLYRSVDLHGCFVVCVQRISQQRPFLAIYILHCLLAILNIVTLVNLTKILNYV